MSVDFEKRGSIGYITINRPHVRNCLNDEALEALSSIWEEFRQDDALLVAIITGAGDQAFCTGADLKELIPRIAQGELAINSRRVQAFLKGPPIFKPIIAAINGACLAGGTELIQGTDIRIAVDDATFGLPEPRWGLFPAGGSTVRLPRQIPYCRAMEILLTGGTVTAQEALHMGLINRVVRRTDLLAVAREIAGKICENSPRAVQVIKQSALRCADIPLDNAYELETFYGREVFGFADAQEGPRAFLEGRRPRFVRTSVSGANEG
ncbi:MAG: enoyl-CoA hydratase [Sulfobacillus acidophilus]|uniref:Enoyl-CoA hydratase n=1 Tax=Sulfobacillus acidophilus TaxID=53633 RepID=A0A2T2WLW1_9FIRM|nr:MAG: enoyl-CoA hydratase [Sulfobacillus acidophilus]